MNLKFLNTLIRNTAMAVLMGALIVVAGCDDDDDGPTIFDGTVAQLIAADEFKQSVNGDPTKSLDSLVKYLNKYPDLVAVAGGTADITLFGPSNTAFVNLLATPGFPANIEDINPAIIQGVLTYHVVSGENLQSSLTSGASLTTLYKSTNPCSGTQTDQTITVNSNGTLKTGSTNQEIDVLDADNLANNGVLHVVESVMIPPATGASLTPILGTLTATVLLGADFTYLAQAVTKADCGVAGVTPLANILASTGPWTAFLPPNDVFSGTAAAQSITVTQLIANFSAAQWRNIILNHVVSGSNNNAALTNGLVLNTALSDAGAGNIFSLTVETVTPGAPPAGSPIGKRLDTSFTGVGTGLGGTLDAPIYIPDLAHSNGVGHVVGKILFPN